MLLLLLSGGGDLSGPITTPPAPGTGVVTQFPATSGEWRLSLEIAEPPGTTWYDITQFYVGDRYQRGADDYKGKYRASLATVQLQIDSVQAADLEVSADILAPWGQDTTDLFGDNIRLGAGLLMRLSMVREVSDVVVEWLPIWTGRVEVWGDASAARGQVRTHVVSVVDTLADLTNVPVLLDDTIIGYEPYVEEVLTQAAWPFGFDVYADPTAAPGVTADDATSVAAINRMDQITEPFGLAWRTLRSGRIVIHPAPWDTTHSAPYAYANPLLDVYPDGLKFSYAPDFTDVEYITDDDQQPFGISRSVAGVLNSFAVTMPDDGFGNIFYAVDDPISTGRYGVRPYTATWIINNPPAVDDLLDDRAFSESQALPLRTTIDHEGFWPAMAMVDHLDPVTIAHATAEDGLVVTGTGSIRNIVEERTVRDAGLLNWQSTIQIDIDSTETAEALLPVEDLALVSTTTSLLGGDSTATFSWTNPTQPSITPTEVQYRVLGRSLIWLPKSYPGTGADGLLIGSLDPATQYTFQVRLLRRVDGVVTNYSDWRQVVFTTPARIYPVPVPDGTDTNADIPGDPDGDGDCDLTVELQENDGTGWSTVDTFTDSELTDNGDGTYSLTTPIPNSFFNEGSMYRFRSSCDGVAWFTGPEFDPPDDWTDPCPEPPALSTTPYDEAIVYVPKVCNGGEDGDPEFVFQGMQIIEALSGIPGVPGPALAEIQTGLADPDEHSLLAVAQPDWADTPGGIVAYGECPQVVGVTGDKSISVRVNVAVAESCVLFECAGMQLTAAPSGSGWAAGATIYSVDGTIALLSVELNLDQTYTITATFEASTGNVELLVDGASDSTDSFGGATTTIHALPIWRVGAPPESWITDCALWDSLIDAPFTPVDPDDIAGLEAWYDASDSGTIAQSGGNVTQWSDKSGNGHHLTPPGTGPATGSRTLNSLNVLNFLDTPLSTGNTTGAFWYALGANTMFVVVIADTLHGDSNISNAVIEQGAIGSLDLYGLRLAGGVPAANFVNRDNPTDAFSINSTTTPYTAWHLYRTEDTGTAARLYVDGALEAQNASYSGTPLGINYLSVGGRDASGGSRNLDGAVAEILIYDHVLSSGDTAQVEAYLTDKWGL